MLNLKQFRDLPNKPSKLILLDADWLIMNAMTSSVIDEDWGDGIWVYGCDHEKAKSIFYAQVKLLTGRKASWLKDSMIICAWSERPNFRKSLYPDYKANRKDVRKPAGYDAFEAMIKEDTDFVHISEPLLEGDDVMGIIASNPVAFGSKISLIISVDKDFYTIPNTTFFNANTTEIIKQDEFMADSAWIYQTITGDVTDNYKGIPQMGDDAATEWLASPYKLVKETSILKSGKNKGSERTIWKKDYEVSDMLPWDVLVTLAAKQEVSPSDLLVQAQVARILRYEDYNIDEQQVILWEPNPNRQPKISL